MKPEPRHFAVPTSCLAAGGGNERPRTVLPPLPTRALAGAVGSAGVPPLPATYERPTSPLPIRWVPPQEEAPDPAPTYRHPSGQSVQQQGPRSDPGWRLAKTLLKVAKGPTLITDADGNIIAVNEDFCTQLGYRERDALRRPLAMFVDFSASHRQERNSSGDWKGEARARRRGSGFVPVRMEMSAIRDEQGMVSHGVVSLRVDSEASAQNAPTEEQTSYRLDTATGLPKWAHLRAILYKALVSAGQAGAPVAVVLVDLENVRTINRTQGHHKGRMLLAQVAQRLRELVRDIDAVSRLTGDTFGLVLPHCGDRRQLERFSEHVLTAFRHSFSVDEQEVFVHAFIGIAVYPDNGHDVDELLRNAEIALDHAKNAPVSGFQFYAEEMHRAACRRAALESSLHHAADRGELELYYQPQIDLRSNRIVGAEALLRWLHPGWGQVSPGTFIPIAEESGLILGIGEWVLRQATLQYEAWLAQGLQLPRLSVNISGQQLDQGGLLETVSGVLADTHLAGGVLELELTESALMGTGGDNRAVLRHLRGMGVRIAIDDFGTGYSSLNYLHRFPIDAIKLDRSFIAQLPGNRENEAIVRAIIAMADALGLSVVAEGVETREQLNLIRQLGCYEVQGYCFSRPVPATDFAKLLDRGGLPPPLPPPATPR